MRMLTVTDREAGQRLDKLLAKYLNQAGKGFIYKMIRKKNITLNGRRCDGSEKLEEGDQIRLFLSDETLERFSKPEIPAVKKKVKLDVIYEDDQILLVNKPCGMLSQRAEEKDDSLVEHVTAHLLEEGAIAPLYTTVTAWSLRDGLTGVLRDARGWFSFAAVREAEG